MRKTALSLIIFITAAMVVLQSCYPGDELTYSDTDIIATFYDKEADFATKSTYAMPDTIYRLDDEGNPIVDPGANDPSILNKIKDELEGYGFTEETPANADVIVFAVISTSTWVSGGCYSGWYSWYYPYYGWCYPVYYTYDTGTLLIAMIEKDTTEEKDGLWVAAMNGLLGDNNSGTLTRINQGIEQAFSQSPYLGAGK
ncbi:MAG: DUF4136 domain-containing protein [Ignavibacteriaceae bacterium]|nr:DUF4136 domain-containing protein [Ignavibacteriaceae bacterium]